MVEFGDGEGLGRLLLVENREKRVDLRVHGAVREAKQKADNEGDWDTVRRALDVLTRQTWDG